MDQTIVNSITVHVSGEILAGAREQARAGVACFLGRLPDCWCSPRVRLTTLRRQGLPRMVLAQANLDFKGQPIRAQVTARLVVEATDQLVNRLAQQLARLADPDEPRAWPPDTPRPEPVALPATQRRVARTKRYPLTRCDPDQAGLLMDIRDHDFYLFTDATLGDDGFPDAGADAVIYRVGPTGYRLARLDGLVPPPPRTTLPVTVNVHPVPRHTPAQAATQLGATDLGFQFFRHADTGRGAVIYRRYDGHYGLLTASGGPTPQRRATAIAWQGRAGQ